MAKIIINDHYMKREGLLAANDPYRSLFPLEDESNYFTEEDYERLKKIGECNKAIDEEQGLDSIIITPAAHCKTISISAETLFFNKYSNEKEWKLQILSGKPTT